MEFKYSVSATAYSLLTILIESQWNLNLEKLVLFQSPLLILIESQWNLNHYEEVNELTSVIILIESQWNLNEGFKSEEEKYFEY